MNLIVLLIVIILLTGGGGVYLHGAPWGGPNYAYGFGGLGGVIALLIIFRLLGLI